VTRTAEKTPEDIPGKEAKNTMVENETASGETAQTQTRTPNHHRDGDKYSKAAVDNHDTERPTVEGEFAVRGRKEAATALDSRA
jgi:hypothetical protein